MCTAASLVLANSNESLPEGRKGGGVGGLFTGCSHGLSDSPLSEEEQTDTREDERKGSEHLGPEERLVVGGSSDLQGNDFREEGRNGEDSENHTGKGGEKLETSNLGTNGTHGNPNSSHNETVEDSVENEDTVRVGREPDGKVKDDNEKGGNKGHVDSAKLVGKVANKRSTNGHGARHDGGNVGSLVVSESNGKTRGRHGVEHDNVAGQGEEAPGEDESTLVVEKELVVEGRELELEAWVGLPDEKRGDTVDDKSHDAGSSEGPLETPDVDPSLGSENEQNTSNTGTGNGETVGKGSLLQEPHGDNVDSGHEQNTQRETLEKTLRQVQVPDLGSKRGRHLGSSLHASANEQKNSEIDQLRQLDVERGEEETGSEGKTTDECVVSGCSASKGLVSQVMGQKDGERGVDTPRGSVDGHGTANSDPAVASIGRRSESRRKGGRSGGLLTDGLLVLGELSGHDRDDPVQLVADCGENIIVRNNVSTENNLVFVITDRLDGKACD